jgi:hypothetical protein
MPTKNEKIKIKHWNYLQCPLQAKIKNDQHAKMDMDIETLETGFEGMNSTVSWIEGRVTRVITGVPRDKKSGPWKIKHSGRHCTSYTVIKVLLDTGSDGDSLLRLFPLLH